MGSIILSLLILLTVSTALFQPWIGIVSYYLLALLGPQYMWPWVFSSIRTSFLVALFTIIGIGVKIIAGKFDFRFLKTRQNLCLLVLLVFIVASFFYGAYSAQSRAQPSVKDPNAIFVNTCKIFFYYFCATLVVNDVKRLRFLFYALVVTTVCLVYWANVQYVTGNWVQFNAGRLMGPNLQGSIYGDENAFGMLFAAGLPFVFYAGTLARIKWLRYALWMIIPFGMHAIFLTASRGALLGLGAGSVLMMLQAKKKWLLLLLLPILLFFFQWQAGSVMKGRSATISSYEGESSAESRLIAWEAGMRMVQDHPLVGVGIGSFMTAFPSYVDAKPIIAHNTLVQYAAESGIVAGACYLLIAYLFFANNVRTRRLLEGGSKDGPPDVVETINKACCASFAAFFTCSMFLSLNTYEVFFYLLVLGNSLTLLASERVSEAVPLTVEYEPGKEVTDRNEKVVPLSSSSLGVNRG